MRQLITIGLLGLLSVFGMCRYDIPIGFAQTPQENGIIQK